MTNEKINATVEEIMEYETLLDEVKGIVDGLKDNLKNEMAERKVESLSTDRYTVRWTTPRNSRRFTKIFIPRFFVRHAQDVFQSVHEILLSWFKK